MSQKWDHKIIRRAVKLLIVLFSLAAPAFADDNPGCLSAQKRCLEGCQRPAKGGTVLPGNFLEACATACAAGVPACASATAEQKDKCHQFLWTCQDACPDVLHDRSDNVYTETRAGRRCLNSCYDGSLGCF